MAFDELLWNCLIPGAASAKEQGIGIALERSGATVLFFRCDCDEFRSEFDVPRAQVCDLLVYYCRDPKSPVLLFVELKGSDLLRAVAQIRSAQATLKSHISERHWKRAKIKALIVTPNSVPPKRQGIPKEVEVRQCSKHKNLDISEFFR